jgi:8-oxo-dGTP pyrophosphatase MutT (NUDIX family)
MKEEKSCGCLIFDGNKVLLIKSVNDVWGFPKGHMEGNETELETAKREVKEETNLDVKIFEDRRYTIKYVIEEKDVFKEVVYFKAEKIGGNELSQEGEVTEIKWLDISEALDTLTFDNTKDVLRKCVEDE